MRNTSIVAALAIALAASVGSPSAAEQFTTLDRIQAESMNEAEMAATRRTADVWTAFILGIIDNVGSLPINQGINGPGSGDLPAFITDKALDGHIQ